LPLIRIVIAPASALLRRISLRQVRRTVSPAAISRLRRWVPSQASAIQVSSDTDSDSPSSATLRAVSLEADTPGATAAESAVAGRGAGSGFARTGGWAAAS
jgi:hypothetical protein